MDALKEIQLKSDASFLRVLYLQSSHLEAGCQSFGCDQSSFLDYIAFSLSSPQEPGDFLM
jgi:hypothetical protein